MIYLDYAATTPCDKMVLNAMEPYFIDIFGNPNSLHHFGEAASDAVFAARLNVASLIGADVNEIVFTSGATESINIAIERVASFFKRNNKNHIITEKTEHKAVLDVCKRLEMAEFEVTFLDVDEYGLVDPCDVERHIKEETSLVSVHFVNNETGVIQRVGEISSICQKFGVLLHTDATQAVGKISVNVVDIGCDFLSGSGHKMYGPKGIGFLFFKKRHLSILKVVGANHEVEFGIRAGTVPVPLCVGLGEASKIAKSEMSENYERIKILQERLIGNLKEELSEIYINGATESHYPGITNISFRGVEGEALMMEANEIAVSSGSACTSNKLSISHVLDAMKISPDIAQSSLRISIGKNTTEDDVNVASSILISGVKKLRDMSPIWDMIRSGVDVGVVFNKEEESCDIAMRH